MCRRRIFYKYENDGPSVLDNTFKIIANKSIIEIRNIYHFHSCIWLKNSNQSLLHKLIIIKYDDII